MTETGSVQAGGATIEYTVRRSARRKKTIEISLRGPGEIVVAAPQGATDAEIRAIVTRRAAWILENHKPGKPLHPVGRWVTGETLPLEGRDLRLEIEEPAEVAAVRIRATATRLHIRVSANLGDTRETTIEDAVIRWYRRRAKAIVAAAIDHWAPLVGRQPAGVRLGNQRTRWGSAGTGGILRFNWRIAMLDPAIANYIAVHELCHLDHPHHRPPFWRAVRVHIPNADALRRRLRDIEGSLPL